MKKLYFILTIIFSLFTFFGCQNKQNYTKAQLKKMITTNNPKNYVLDVRTHLEYNGNNIPRSINAPLDVLEERIGNITTNKEDIIIVYCKSGNRSKQAKEKLEKLGYKNVYDFGSIDDYFD